jgi:hypothetical protein
MLPVLSLGTVLSALLGVPQNDAATIILHQPPFLDLLERSKAAEAGEVIVQTAISYARGLNRAVDIAHVDGP